MSDGAHHDEGAGSSDPDQHDHGLPSPRLTSVVVMSEDPATGGSQLSAVVRPTRATRQMSPHRAQPAPNRRAIRAHPRAHSVLCSGTTCYGGHPAHRSSAGPNSQGGDTGSFSVEVGSQWKPSQLRPTLDVAVFDLAATAVAVLSVDGLVRHQDSMPDRSGKNRSARRTILCAR
jgi:hypothetical protein